MMSLRYLSLFSGIEAAHLAWSPLGWGCVAVAEIEPAPCDVLAHRLPGVPNLGDVSAITYERIAALGPINVVIGGSPCQDLSVAGKRKGLAGARSGLFHEQLRIFDAARSLCGARWLVWENVPGAFSSNRGRDFGVVVGAMAGLNIADADRIKWETEGVALGPRGLVEWSVLDAQFFGLAQRRKRVFAVLDTGNWTDRGPVLVEPESLRGDSPPRREEGEGVAGSSAQSVALRGREGGGSAEVGGDVAFALRASSGGGDKPHVLIPAVAGTLRSGSGGVCGPDADGTVRGVPLAIGYRWAASANESMSCDEIAPPIRAARNGEPAVGVRRLTPRECERLQGAPDDFTIVPRGKSGKPMADSPRYKMLGNSFAVPVVRWIGEQIARAHAESSAAIMERAA